MSLPTLIFLIVALGYGVLLMRLRVRAMAPPERTTPMRAQSTGSPLAPLLILIGLATLLFIGMLILEILLSALQVG